MASVLFDGLGAVSCVRRGDAEVEGGKKRVWCCQRERQTRQDWTEVERGGGKLRAG
jgi:hypothetical protein